LEELRSSIDQTLRIVFLIVIQQGWMEAADMVHGAVKRTGQPSFLQPNRLSNH